MAILSNTYTQILRTYHSNQCKYAIKYRLQRNKQSLNMSKIILYMNGLGIQKLHMIYQMTQFN